ncbi:DUF5685 family protein [Catellatospora coxensis]
MFGIIRPCAHSLSERLHGEWLGHLCGLCLALRDEHGQAARIVTNYDGLIISVLTQAQQATVHRRTAGPCPLRGMRTAPVAQGVGARLAATVSLVLASAKLSDHAADGDGAYARRPVAAGARLLARRWATRAHRSGLDLGLDTGVLLTAVHGQREVERAVTLGGSLLTVTEPTELATAAAFAHTAVLAGRPGNADPLAEAGRFFGRIAHLLDAVEDLAADRAAGAWNPLLATGASFAQAGALARTRQRASGWPWTRWPSTTRGWCTGCWCTRSSMPSSAPSPAPTRTTTRRSSSRARRAGSRSRRAAGRAGGRRSNCRRSPAGRSSAAPWPAGCAAPVRSAAASRTPARGAACPARPGATTATAATATAATAATPATAARSANTATAATAAATADPLCPPGACPPLDHRTCLAPVRILSSDSHRCRASRAILTGARRGVSSR